MRLHRLGPRAVLVKGLAEGSSRVDVLYDGSALYVFRSRTIRGADPHGTGCALASGIAANLALGRPLVEAISRSRRLVRAAIRARFRPAERGLEYLGIPRRAPGPWPTRLRRSSR